MNRPASRGGLGLTIGVDKNMEGFKPMLLHLISYRRLAMQSWAKYNVQGQSLAVYIPNFAQSSHRSTI
jgi:hypothetical protein